MYFIWNVELVCMPYERLNTCCGKILHLNLKYPTCIVYLLRRNCASKKQKNYFLCFRATTTSRYDLKSTLMYVHIKDVLSLLEKEGLQDTIMLPIVYNQLFLKNTSLSYLRYMFVNVCVNLCPQVFKIR